MKITRDEAKQEFNNYGYTIHEQDVIVDRIFDYFEPIEQIAKQNVLDSFNGMSCENCKHWNMEYINLGVCSEGVDTENIYDIGSCTQSDFCCNRWESKDEKYIKQ